MIDASPLWAAFLQALIGLAAAAITAGGSMAVIYLRERLTANKVGRVVDATVTGAGIAYNYMLEHGGAGELQAVKNTALALGTNYVLGVAAPGSEAAIGTTTGKLAASLGWSREHVAEIVAGKLGGFLAADPNVTLPRS